MKLFEIKLISFFEVKVCSGMKSQKNILDRGYKRQNVVSVASEHTFQAKKSFDAREKLKTFQGAASDARMKLLPKMPINDRIKVTLPQRDARAKLAAKQNNQQKGMDFEKCDDPSNFQLANIKKTLVKGFELQTSNMGWSLMKTVANDVTKASPAVNFTPPQAISKTVLNTPTRKVAQLNSGDAKSDEKTQCEDKEPSQTFVSPIQSYRVVISNLGPNVTYDDVEELFSSCGPLRKIKMSKPGSAEIFYVNVESAYEAVEEYHNRELDDRPMSVVVSLLQDVVKVNETKPLRSKKQLLALKQSLEVDPHVLSQALFRSSADLASVDFTVHL